MCLADIKDGFGENIHNGSESILDQFLQIRGTLLDVPLMFKIPLEANLILFILVNIYKGIYVIANMSGKMINYFAALTILVLALEMPVVGDSAQIWVCTVLCSLLPIPMVLSATYAAILTCILICFSQLLAFCVDMCFLLLTCERVSDFWSWEFQDRTTWYFLACNVISAVINWQVTTRGLTLFALFLIALYVASTAVYFYIDEEPYQQLLYMIFFKVEVVVYMMFPLLLDVYYKNCYGEKLTYTLQYFKSL